MDQQTIARLRSLHDKDGCVYANHALQNALDSDRTFEQLLDAASDRERIAEEAKTQRICELEGMLRRFGEAYGGLDHSDLSERYSDVVSEARRLAVRDGGGM